MIKFEKISEAMDFINSLDGCGLVVTDDVLLHQTLINTDLEEDDISDLSHEEWAAALLS